MFEYLKFSIGSMESGYKTVVLRCENGDVHYEILRSGLLGIAKGKHKADVSDDCFTGWTALNIAAWDAIYTSPHSSNGEVWRLTVREDGATYKSRGESSYPRQWDQFLRWLDALMPEMAFVAQDQIECARLSYKGAQPSGYFLVESLIMDRQKQHIVVEKNISSMEDGVCRRKSRHVYEVSYGMQEALEHFQSFRFSRDAHTQEAIKTTTPPETSSCGERLLLPEYFPRNSIEAVFHPEISLDVTFHALPELHLESVPKWLRREDCEKQWNRTIRQLHALLPDIEAKLLSPETYRLELHGGKYIYCKVRFPDSYRLYSYRTEDESLQIGDMVDVPVGQDNNVICGQIENIGYFNEMNAPYPVHKTKLIIGKHEEDEENESEY